jgi:hypothetical protein
MILAAIVRPLLISKHGNSETTLFCSQRISDNDFGRSFCAVGCGQVATRETIDASPPSISAIATPSASGQLPSSLTTLPMASHSNETSSSSTLQTVTIITTPPTKPAVAPNSTSVPPGPIIGGAVGGVSVICLTVLVVFLIWHRKRRASSGRSSSLFRGSSSCKKHDVCEEPPELYRLVSQRTRYEPSVLGELVELQ